MITVESLVSLASFPSVNYKKGNYNDKDKDQPYRLNTSNYVST